MRNILSHSFFSRLSFPSQEHGDIKALHTKLLSVAGLAVLAFYDLRHATRALHHLRQDIFEGRRLDVRYCPLSELAHLTDDPSVVSNGGSVLILQEGDMLEHFALKVAARELFSQTYPSSRVRPMLCLYLRH